MNILDFSKRIKTFSKNEIIKSFNETKAMLDTLNDPVNELRANSIDYCDLMNAVGLQSTTKALTQRLPRGLDSHALISGVLSSALQLNKLCIEEFNKSKQSLITGETVTIKQANCMLVNANLDMWVEFTNRVIQVGSSVLLGNRNIKKPDAAFFSDNAAAYEDISRVLFEQQGVLVKRLKALPELPVDEATVDVLEQTKGKDALIVMPVRAWGIHSFLPIYWYGTVKMELDLWRIRVHAERIESNSMKIQQLRDNQLNNPNAANEHAIDVYENKIIKSQDRIEAIQRSYDYHE